ncbi:hypothetical protein BC936DRAFT_140956 [Jimgerdemannia flammicorona]|uniref:Protein kinase domain-containing protein n=1 Tax=Jimgerdemannia flammicorona TaxID=994334 RepID=A0A433DGG5_9FUNG|nr:hypothetical protein BC936DRAFT_140956 [Jimgerdemannia flammicorona]
MTPQIIVNGFWKTGVTFDSTANEYIFVQQYCTHGALGDYLRDRQLTWNNRIQLAHDVALGLSFIHYRGIVHRDLHIGNILVDEKGRCVITDFGISKMLGAIGGNTVTELIGCTPFIPPERLLNPRYIIVQGCDRGSASVTFDKTETDHDSYLRVEHDQRGDIYSFGVVCWVISSGIRPFVGTPYGIPLALKIAKDMKRESPIPGTPGHYQAMYTKCWDGKPEARPTMVDIISSLVEIKYELEVAEGTSDSAAFMPSSRKIEDANGRTERTFFTDANTANDLKTLFASRVVSAWMATRSGTHSGVVLQIEGGGEYLIHIKPPIGAVITPASNMSRNWQHFTKYDAPPNNNVTVGSWMREAHKGNFIELVTNGRVFTGIRVTK